MTGKLVKPAVQLVPETQMGACQKAAILSAADRPKPQHSQEAACLPWELGQGRSAPSINRRTSASGRVEPKPRPSTPRMQPSPALLPGTYSSSSSPHRCVAPWHSSRMQFSQPRMVPAGAGGRPKGSCARPPAEQPAGAPAGPSAPAPAESWRSGPGALLAPHRHCLSGQGTFWGLANLN